MNHSTALVNVKVVDLCFTDYKDIDDRYYQYQIRATFHTQFEYQHNWSWIMKHFPTSELLRKVFKDCLIQC